VLKKRKKANVGKKQEKGIGRLSIRQGADEKGDLEKKKENCYVF